MNFTKMQGAGNDFVIIETDDEVHDWTGEAAAICDRHYGIGADGLLLLMPSDIADFRMRIFNVDGSEAEACGNGLRCLVKYFVDNGSTETGDKQITIETFAGIRKARVHREKGIVITVQTGMGEPKLKADDIPVLVDTEQGSLADIKSMLCYTINIEGNGLPLNLVSMGNPHAVLFVDEPVSNYPLEKLGPIVEKHRIFPKRINFEVVRVMNKQQIEARVWEKGVGETLACGSGACAITVAAILQDYVDNGVDIKLPGGTLNVEWDGEGEVLLSGPAEIVFTGQWTERY
jgi:diaminopimelate epimerase